MITRIFTDTSANLPVEMVKKYDITVVPFRYCIDGKDCYSPADGHFDGESFYQAMANGTEVKTSMINAFGYCEAMEEAAAAGGDILYIGMSSGISGSYMESLVAINDLRERYPKCNIAAIDTRAASLGEGLQVIYAAELARKGCSFQEIYEKTQDLSDHICQYFTVEDLEYLRRGGRLSRVTSVVGNILNIKPILMGNEEGEIVLFHKVRGRKRSLDALADKYRTLVQDPASPVGIAHAACEEAAAYLEAKLRSYGCTGDITTVLYEPVTGSHVGPGTVALFFYGVHR